MAKSKINRLFWDIETAPCKAYVWRSGWKITIPVDNIFQESSIICICYKWEGSNKVESIEWDNGDDKELCKEFMEVAELADEMVAHNGNRFDMPAFKARCVYHGLEPNPIYKTVDTLTMARGKFRFNSNRLDYLGKHLLGEGKISTDFSMWIDILEDNCEKAMAKMVKYCKKDVALLERVYHKLSPYSNENTHVGVLNGLDAWTCPKCGSEDVKRNGMYVTSMGVRKSEMKCNCCGRRYRISLSNLKKYTEHRYNERNKVTTQRGSRKHIT